MLSLEDAAPSLFSDVVFDAAPLGDPLNKRLGHVCVELIDDKDPGSIGVAVDRSADMRDEVLFGAGGADGVVQNLPRGNVEVSDEAQRPVPDVVELATLDQTGSYRQRHVFAFKRLDPGFLIARNNVRAVLLKVLRSSVDVAHVLHITGVLRGVVSFFWRRKPVLALVGPDIGLLLKNDQGVEQICCLRGHV